MDFTHIVVTRFSAVFTADAEPMPEEWLRYRLGFFVEALCASMDGQTTRDFRWLVYLDDRCSPEFRAELEDLAERHGFEPVWTHEPFHARLRADLAARCATAYLITTRVDSDDAVARDFVEAVQAQFEHQERMFVSFTDGLQLDRSGAVYRLAFPAGPFMSLIERRDDGDPLGVFCCPHGSVRTVGPLREVVGPPRWLMVVHGTNLMNEVTGPRVRPGVLAERFDLVLGHRSRLPWPTYLRERGVQAARRWGRRARTLDGAWVAVAAGRARGTRDLPQSAQVHGRAYAAARGARDAVRDRLRLGR